MWHIKKSFDFCYGHRVYTQNLDKEFAINDECVCRHLHGHQGRVTVSLVRIDSRLDRTGMVTDFRHLNWLKVFIDTYIDHKFIIDELDPIFGKLIDRKTVKFEPIEVEGKVVGYSVKSKTGDPHLDSLYNSFTVVRFVPTSENLAAWIAEIVNLKMKKLKVEVNFVEWQETPKSASVYSPMLNGFIDDMK